MILPYQLSDEALAVLRLFTRAKALKEDDGIDRRDLEAAWKGDAAGLAKGLADLGTAQLVTAPEGGADRAVVTADGAAFFRRFYHSCY